jgi:coiled-coil domain-containing protein 102A
LINLLKNCRREKWAKVRNERNQARDEAKQLRAQLEATLKESNGFKREKHDLEIQVQHLKKEMEKIHHSLIKHASNTCKDPERDISGSPDQYSNDGLKNVNSEDGLVTKARSFSENESNSESKLIDDYVLQGALPKDIKNIEVEIEEKQLIQKLKISKSEDMEDDSEYLIQRSKMLQLRLDDAQKAIIAEKELVLK